MSKLDPQRSTSQSDPRLSRACAGRLSLYLRFLEGQTREGATKISSGQLGEAVGVSDAQVRKDLAALGSLGQPGIGYSIPDLVTVIRRMLGIDRDWKAVLVGVGNLARALLRYRGFRQQGFQVVALFDSDPTKSGQSIEGLPIRPLTELRSTVRETGAELGIVSVPAEAAQAVVDELAEAGIRGILNFAPTVLKMPSGVSLVTVDLTVQLEQLAFQVQWTTADARPSTR